MAVDLIALLGPIERLPIWEDRVLKSIRPTKLILASNINAITPDINVCIYITSKYESATDTIAALIKKGIHTLVITPSMLSILDVSKLMLLNDESRVKVWFSLWGLFQPGLSTIYDRLSEVEYINTIKKVETKSDIAEFKYRAMFYDECLLAAKWLKSPIKEVQSAGNDESKFALMRAQNGKMATFRVTYENGISETSRYMSGLMDASFESNKHGNNATFLTNGQKIPIQLISDKTAADVLLDNFFRDVRGLPVKPSFTLDDLNRYGVTQKALI